MSDWVRQLGHDLDWSVQPVSPEWTLELCREKVGEEPVAWAVARAYENAQRVAREVPELGTPDGRMRATRLGAESNMLHVLLILCDVRATGWWPEELTQVVQDLVRRRLPLPRLLAGIRVAHSMVAQTYLEACAKLVPPPAAQAQELQRVSSLVMDLFAGLTAQAEVEFVAESERWFLTNEETRQSDAVSDLLYRAPNDIAQVEKALKYPLLKRRHLAAVAWLETGVVPDQGKLEEALKAWLNRAGARYVLTVKQGTSAVWGWGAAGPDERSNLPAEDFAMAGARVAFGTWGMNLNGFRASHREALAAEHVAALCPSLRSPAVAYANVSLLSVLLSDLGRATDFAVAELGPLAGKDARSCELRSTVQAYLELRSPKAVAEQKFVARGTVSYRLRQAQELLGHDLLSRATELGVAIKLVESLPDLRPRAAGD